MRAASPRGGFPWDRRPCRTRGPHTSHLTRLNGEAKLDNLWHQVREGAGGRAGTGLRRRRGRDAQRRTRAGCTGSTGEQAGCRPAPQHEQQENKCLDLQEKLMPSALIPLGFPYALTGAGERHDAPALCMGQQRVQIPQNITSQHSIPSRSHVLCCPLGSEAEPDIAFSPPLPGASWNFHNR